MRILFIRHGDPNYINDTLTEKGHWEAARLAESAADLRMGDCYMSPLGRAQLTAAYSLKKIEKTALVLDWLQEIPATIDINVSNELQHCYRDTRLNDDGTYQLRGPMGILPSYWTKHPEYMDPLAWRESEIAKCSRIVTDYDAIAANLDALLAKYGYVRERGYYRVEKESTQTITLFCHFGVTCAMLSHLWNISPFILWNALGLLPTSVSEVISEEQEHGIAYFRGLRLGDRSHLDIGKDELFLPADSVSCLEIQSSAIPY